jgi:hypothetical protein
MHGNLKLDEALIRIEPFKPETIDIRSIPLACVTSALFFGAAMEANGALPERAQAPDGLVSWWHAKGNASDVADGKTRLKYEAATGTFNFLVESSSDLVTRESIGVVTCAGGEVFEYEDAASGSMHLYRVASPQAGVIGAVVCVHWNSSR